MRRKWTFDGGRDGWRFDADTFLFTDAPGYARGFLGASGRSGGALGLRLGGRDGRDVDGMSGAWSKGFRLDEPENVSLTFWYKLKATPHLEGSERSELRVALDGATLRSDGRDWIARQRGDGDGGAAPSTGWRKVTLDLGLLDAGRHTLEIGGLLKGKDARNEVATLLIDAVALRSAPPDPAASLAGFERRVLKLTNDFREKNGKPAFENDARLNAAAEDWSRTMAKDDAFAHSDPGQVEEFGYDWSRWGENIAAGQATPAKVVKAWINSPGHRANLLGDFEDIGIGYYRLAGDGGDAAYTHYWTQAFGTEQGDTLL